MVIAMPRVTTTFKIEGLQELEDALSEFPKATAKNTIRRAIDNGSAAYNRYGYLFVQSKTHQAKHCYFQDKI